MKLSPLLALLRPRQWLKNLVVFSGALLAHAGFLPALSVAAAFSLLASCCYVANDLLDLERDRLHPTKRLRPLAAGTVSVGAALGAAVACLGGGLLLAGTAGGPALLLCVLYLALQLSYNAGGKHLPLVDIWTVAAGFLLRYLAGTAALGLPGSAALALSCTLLTLYLVTSKRYAEACTPGALMTRPVLQHYPTGLLQAYLAMLCLGTTAAAMLTSPPVASLCVGYGLWRYQMLLSRYGQDPVHALVDTRLAAAVATWTALTVCYGT